MLKHSFLIFITIKTIISHSWLDCVNQTTEGCQGFVRGYVGHIDDPMTYRLEYRNNELPACHPNTQDSPNNYSKKYPRTQAKPGQLLKFTYLENGHVTKDRLPPNNQPNPKFYTLHWTGKPFTGNLEDGSQLRFRADLTPETIIGGPYPFDDGQCAEDNSMGRQPRPCVGEFKIPDNVKPGVYQFIWWWKFDKDPKAGGEEYTSCFDVEVTDGKMYPTLNNNNNNNTVINESKVQNSQNEIKEKERENEEEEEENGEENENNNRLSYGIKQHDINNQHHHHKQQPKLLSNFKFNLTDHSKINKNVQPTSISPVTLPSSTTQSNKIKPLVSFSSPSLSEHDKLAWERAYQAQLKDII